MQTLAAAAIGSCCRLPATAQGDILPFPTGELAPYRLDSCGSWQLGLVVSEAWLHVCSLHRMYLCYPLYSSPTTTWHQCTCRALRLGCIPLARTHWKVVCCHRMIGQGRASCHDSHVCRSMYDDGSLFLAFLNQHCSSGTALALVHTVICTSMAQLHQRLL